MSEKTEKDLPSADLAWVYRSDSFKYCDDHPGTAIERDASILEAAGISPITDRGKFTDDLARAQMCGMDAGRFNGYLIPRSTLDKARAAGFLPKEDGKMSRLKTEKAD